MAINQSLFEPASTPVLQAGADWINQAVLGSVAITLCSIAVATIGLLMMTGRLHIREALRIVLGCFMLLGAPTIAASLMGLTNVADQRSSGSVAPITNAQPAETPPPSNYDPYAGASLRID